jgi:hypothetical protein
MSLFSLKKSTERTGVIIDIGSGSVLVAIVLSDQTKEKPLILWSHREQAPLKNIDSVDQAAKSVMTSLINALLKFDSEGRKALYDFNKKTTIDEVQCAICAPWSYTVSKRITYGGEDEFSVTRSLISELVATALEQTNNELHEHEAVNELGLTIITRCTTDILVNGYRVKKLPDAKATDLSLSHISVVAQQYLIDHLQDLRHKIFADKPLRKVSYMLAMYAVAEENFDDSGDFCLVDVTYEATEIGIVRDGVLTYSTHIPYGSFSLAREIAAITNVPLYQAFQYLHEETPLPFIGTLPEEKQADVEAVFSEYTDRLAKLMRETGDELSVPKRMYLHTDKECESLFTSFLQNANKRIHKTEAHVIPLSSKMSDIVDVAKDTGGQDTAMLVSATFFHTYETHRTFEYL